MEFITTDQRIAVENFYIGKIYTITFKNGSYITRACIGKGADYVMFQVESPKMLFTLNMQTAANIDSIELGGGGSGTTNYNELDNKPQINSVTLSGNKSSSDLGLQDAISSEDPLPASYVSGLANVATTGAYSDLTGLPTLGTAAAAAATDFATAAQGSKADAADTAISTAATGFASLDARLDSMDTTISGKQGALSSAQLDAVNSGIDSTKVAQIETNKNNISSVLDSNGTKNKIKVEYINTSHANGVTYTVNSDGTVTANGTPASSDNSYVVVSITQNGTYEDFSSYCNGNNILSGCPTGGGMSTYRLYLAGTGESQSYLKQDYGSGVELTATSYNNIYLVFFVYYGYTANNLVFKPMICDKPLWDVSHTYKPYALSNVELTEQLTTMQADGRLVDGGTRTTTSCTIPLSQLGDGIYTVSVVNIIIANPQIRAGVSTYTFRYVNSTVEFFTAVKEIANATISSIAKVDTNLVLTYGESGNHYVALTRMNF